MTGPRWTGWTLALWLLPIGAVVLVKASGLATVGLVTTGSMEPVLPPGSLVVALRAQAAVGDVVVYQAPDGGRVVHRVVDRAPDGLITQGDANERTDQAAGMEPIPPGRVNVVPEIGDAPAALKGTWMRPLGLVAAQVVLLTVGFKSLLTGTGRDRVPWPLRAARPHTLLLAAGTVLLLAAPALHETVEAQGAVQVQGLPVPTLVTVDTGEGTTYHTLSPLSTTRVDIQGVTEIVRVPAMPGARTLAPLGATWAMLPTTVTTWAAALLLRMGERA